MARVVGTGMGMGSAMRIASGTLRSVWAAACVVGLTAGAAWGQSEQAARKKVQDMFGRQIQQARATSDKGDDLQTAELLYEAAANPRTPGAVRVELARAAMELSIPIGTAPAATLSEKYLDRWTQLGKKGLDERYEWLVKIRTAQVAKAKSPDRRAATTELVRATGALAIAYQKAKKLDQAAAYVIKAMGEARRANLTDLLEELTLANTEIQCQRSFLRDKATAEAELAAAVAGNNAPLIKASYEKIGLLHLLRNADPASAAASLANAKHAWAAPAGAVGYWMQTRRIQRSHVLGGAEMLMKAAEKAHIGAKAKLLETLVGLCDYAQQYLKPDDKSSARLTMLRSQARVMLERLPNSTISRLRKALKALAGTVVFAADGSVTINYFFSSARLSADWQQTGKWTVAKGLFGCSAGKETASAHHIVRFRADRPLSVSFSGRTSGGMFGVTLFRKDDTVNVRRCMLLTLGMRNTRQYLVNGMAGRQNGWLARPLAQPFTVVSSHDGKGNFSWTVAGQALPPRGVRKDWKPENFRVGFVLYAGAKGGVSGVSIKGTPYPDAPVVTSGGSLLDPTAKPSAPADTSPGGRPPRRRR